MRAAGRSHGDHFRWDIRRPGFAENRHRTNALDVDVLASRTGTTTRVTFGGGGGGDWITSSNLGDHTYGRGHGFVESLWTPAGRTSVQAGLRYDHYSTFGGAWSPSAAVSIALTDSTRLRASAARAFRIPTFTERFYSDPAHLASDNLTPERGWSIDTGLDATSGPWTMSLSPFIRWDDGVIDWVRAVPTDRWRTTNVRDVTTRGLEASVTYRVADTLVRAHYAALDLDAPDLTLLSKYVLEYARHSAGLSISLPVAPATRLAVNADGRRRLDGQRYVLLGARVTRALGRLDLFVEGSNLLDASYREVAGVAMPGRWLTAGIRLR